MKKRQRKKNKNKYITIIADEGNLVTMTQDERVNAYKEYEEYRKKYGFKKKYKDLKKAKPLLYLYQTGKSNQEFISSIAKRARKARKGGASS